MKLLIPAAYAFLFMTLGRMAADRWEVKFSTAIACISGYLAFTIVRAVYRSYQELPRTLTEHVSLHARLVIALILPIIVSTLLRRFIVYFAPLGVLSYIIVAFAVFVPLSDKLLSYLFPTSNQNNSPRLLGEFVAHASLLRGMTRS